MFGLAAVGLLAAFSTLVSGSPINETQLVTRDDAKNGNYKMDCPPGPPGGWQPYMIGGPDGDGTWCMTQFGQDYSPVKTLKMWLDPYGGHIGGIQLKYASGVESRMMGHAGVEKGDPLILDLDPKKPIEQMLLYGDGYAKFLGTISITIDGKTTTYGKSLGDGSHAYEQQHGSGILLGARVTEGKNGDGNTMDIINAGFLFLGSDIDKIKISDIKYDKDPNGNTDNIDTQTKVVGEWYNDLPTTAGFSYSPAYQVTDSHTFGSSVTAT